jgi:hypothetical protein
LNSRLEEFVKSPVLVAPMRPRRERLLRRRWDKETIAEAVRLYDSGMTVATMAERFGAGKSAVLRLLREEGVVRSRAKLSPGQVDEAIRLCTSGLLLRQVGERMGVSRDCVRLALKRRGVVLRPGLGARGDC